jgi:hypothetical protein
MYRKQRSIAAEPFRSLYVLLHFFKTVVERDLPARKKALKIELWHAGEQSGLTQGQAFLLEQRQRQFGLQLGFSQPGRLEELV